ADRARAARARADAPDARRAAVRVRRCGDAGGCEPVRAVGDARGGVAGAAGPDLAGVRRPRAPGGAGATGTGGARVGARSVGVAAAAAFARGQRPPRDEALAVGAARELAPLEQAS